MNSVAPAEQAQTIDEHATAHCTCGWTYRNSITSDYQWTAMQARFHGMRHSEEQES